MGDKIDSESEIAWKRLQSGKDLRKTSSRFSHSTPPQSINYDY